MQLEDLIGRSRDADALVRILRTLADPTRLRLLALLGHGESNVSALCKQMNVAQPTVSHHLATLREAGFVASRRSGKQVFYSLNPDCISQEDGVTVNSGEVSLCLQSIRDGLNGAAARGVARRATARPARPAALAGVSL